MREAPPARYRPSVVERAFLRRGLSQAARMVLRNLERQPFRSLATVLGIALALGLLLFGFVFVDVMRRLADLQFSLVSRQDLTVSFVEPASSRAFFEVRALPGVIRAEPVRVVPARLRFGHRSRQLALTGQLANADLSRVVDLSGRVVSLPARGLVLSKVLGDILGVRPGASVTVEVLEGARPVLEVEVASLVEDYMGLAAFMEIGELRRLLREGGTLSGAHLMVDPLQENALYGTLKRVPAVAGVAVTKAALESFRAIMAQNFDLITTFNVGFAVVIAFGVVYNAARVSLSERARELSSLRVLGFSVAEISLILLGELALLAVLAVLPGLVLGWAMARLLLLAFQNEVYRLPLVVTPQNAAVSVLTVFAATALSGAAVRRRLDRLDLVAVLKARE
jgi:putative ABC transport system permease protein